MPSTGAVVQLDESQFMEAATVLTRAYFDDLFVLYLLPDPAARQEQLRAFMEAGCRLTDLLGHAYTTAGRMDGVALWRPPGAADPPAEWREAAGFPHVAEVWGEDAMGRYATAMTHLGELRHRAMPTAHWYLAGIGVDPPRQGQGVGDTSCNLSSDERMSQGCRAILRHRPPATYRFTRSTGSRWWSRQMSRGEAPISGQCNGPRAHCDSGCRVAVKEGTA
jgi:hypothetical protein